MTYRVDGTSPNEPQRDSGKTSCNKKNNKMVHSLFSKFDLINALDNNYTAVYKPKTKEDVKPFLEIFDKTDSQDLFGNIVEGGDNFYNDNEIKTLRNRLKECFPKCVGVFDKFIEKYETKSDTDKLITNFNMIYKDTTQFFAMGNPQFFSYCMRDLSNDNLLEVMKEYKGAGLFFDAYLNANYWDTTNGTHFIEELKEKSIGYASYLLDIAKKNNIYTEDYEKELNETLVKNDIKYYTIAIQRLADRIIISTDKNKTLDASKRAIEIKEPNGQIDSNYIQGYTGDCWLISSIVSMCSDKGILDKLNSLITVNKKDDIIESVTVNIHGNDYTIDYENLKNANEYATGDLDVRALEIALNKFMHENDLGNGDISAGWFSDDAYKYIFGEDNVEINKFKNENGDFEPEKYLETIKENSNKNILSNIQLNDGESDYLYGKSKKHAKDEDGKVVRLLYSHTYTYKRLDSEYFYFCDPQNQQKELRIPIEEFEDTFGYGVVYKVNLS